MAEENQQEPSNEKSGGPLKLVMLVVGAVALLGIGAAGAHFLGPRFQEPPPPMESAEADAAAAAEVVDASEIADRLVALEPVVVNLGGSGQPRYLKATLELEVSPEHDRETVESAMPVIRDAILVLLSSQRLADLQAFEGKVLLKEEIVDRVNGALREPAIAAVLFTEFIVQ